MANNEDRFGDERLKKGSGKAVRGSREAADSARQQDGGSLSSEERRRLLRQEWVQEILPAVPEDPKFHYCWLSTTNSTDPIYKRIQRGYVPVKASEIPGQFGGQYTVSGGEFDGCIACNEMLLFKIPNEVYQDLMTIYHYDIPNEQEEAIYERVRNNSLQDSSGRNLMEVEGEFERMGRRVPNPTFS
jgi:hypothetical protein